MELVFVYGTDERGTMLVQISEGAGDHYLRNRSRLMICSIWHKFLDCPRWLLVNLAWGNVVDELQHPVIVCVPLGRNLENDRCRFSNIKSGYIGLFGITSGYGPRNRSPLK